jgi:hypothetical protein
VFEHRPGRTVLDVDNTYFTLLTLLTSRQLRRQMSCTSGRGLVS